MTVGTGLIIVGLFALSCGSAVAETASELHRSPQYQEHERALAILSNAPADLHSCVWVAAFGHTWTIDEAQSRIAECQRIRDDYLRNRAISERNQAIINGLPVLTVVISLALAFPFRRRIAAGIYNVFVGILGLGMRIKRFLHHAMKEAEDRRAEKNPPKAN